MQTLEKIAPRSLTPKSSDSDATDDGTGPLRLPCSLLASCHLPILEPHANRTVEVGSGQAEWRQVRIRKDSGVVRSPRARQLAPGRRGNLLVRKDIENVVGTNPQSKRSRQVIRNAEIGDDLGAERFDDVKIAVRARYECHVETADE